MEFVYSFPGVKGIQANKEYYITMIPLKYLAKILPEPKEYLPPEFRAQRRLNESRIPEMKDYIIENRDTYIFSSLTASIDGDYSFEEMDEQPGVGILHINMDAKLLINDGQHRRAAIAQAILEDDSLGDETISVVLFEDRGLEKSQQMFTDLNMNAQKSSNSINTCYETREPLAVMTKEIVSQNEFLNRYTNLEADNLSKNSSHLFTLYTIYRVNKKIIRNVDVKEDDYKFFEDFWRCIVKYISEWNELSQKLITKKDLRENYVTTLKVTLLSFSRVGIWLYEHKNCSMDKYMNRLQDIDWSRKNSAWKNRIIRDDGKIINTENAIILAGNYIKEQLGMELTKDEKKREEIVGLR